MDGKTHLSEILPYDFFRCTIIYVNGKICPDSACRNITGNRSMYMKAMNIDKLLIFVQLALHVMG